MNPDRNDATNNVNNIMHNGRPVPYYHSGWKQYIRQNWMSTFVGVVGLLAGIILIIRNEASAVRISRLLDETYSLAKHIEPNAAVDESNIGNLVYIKGNMQIHEPLTEVNYGISVLAVKLLRQVQMYQWIETHYDSLDSDGNTIGSDYSYYTDWQSNLVDSSLFHTTMGHKNPKEFPIKKQTQINENVKIGNYYIGADLKKKFKDFVPITSDERPENQDIKLHSGLYYHCEDIWNPKVGDVRLQFFYAGQQGQMVTIIAKLDETLTLVPYVVEKGGEISFMKEGSFSVEEMFAWVHSENRFLTWVYRGKGWLLLYLSCISLNTLLDIVICRSRFLREILPNSHSSIKMTVSMCLTLLFTALAWIWYRPILGMGLVVVTVPLLWFTKRISGVRHGERYNRL